MALIIDNKLMAQIKSINLEKDNKVKFSVLLGSIDTENSEISIINAIHFPSNDNNSINELKLSEDEINQLKSLQYMLPYQLEILGLVFYLEEEVNFETLKELAITVEEIPTLKFIINIQKTEINFYQLSDKKPIKITAQMKEIEFSNPLKFLYTMEFETSSKVLGNPKELKRTLFEGLDYLWDKIDFSKNSASSLLKLQKEKNSLDRTIEITIPSEEKHLKSKTETGKVFLALDLHINIFIPVTMGNKTLSDIQDILNKALKQDLVIKLQRSIFDKEIHRLITPGKIPMDFFGIELNAYLLKENPSKYEYQLCSNLIFHAKKMAQLNEGKQARIFIRDLVTYYQILEDTEKQIELGKLITELSSN
ncbi:MAG: hypothetical protein FK734_03725 [Asgard group archaeon]|nr:hypothetical protein [Asgard group archaeon]